MTEEVKPLFNRTYTPDRFTEILRKYKFLGIAGKKRHGKGTTSNVIKMALKSRMQIFEMSLADPLKEATQAMMGGEDTNYYGEEKDREAPMAAVWRERYGEKFNTFRRGLQTNGTDIFRNLVCSTWWIDCFEARALAVAEKFDPCEVLFILPDVRFDNEAAHIKILGGILVEVIRDGYDSVDGHASEKGVSEQYINKKYRADSIFVVRQNAMKIMSDYRAYLNRGLPE